MLTVPVRITVPGRRVVSVESHSMICRQSKIMSAVFESCFDTPFTNVLQHASMRAWA